jgi:methylmalonyl-CoA decarboxylase
MEISAEISAVLVRAGDRVIGDAIAALDQRDQAHRRAPSPAERRHDVEHLFELVQQCLQEGRADPIITPSQQIAADRFVAGVDLADVQASFVVLEDVLWRHLSAELAADQQLETLRLVNAILGTGKDALARTYVALAKGGSGTGTADARPGSPGSAGTDGTARTSGTGAPADAVVQTAVKGQVGIITLDDRHKRNAISARMANGIIAALGSLQAQNMRTIVIRAAAEMSVWSSGHDVGELPQGRRDPLGYDDPLEGLLRAIRTFPAPVVAMVHGTVWGGALDLVLSCDLVTADETASFAITPANLGLPYNTTGLLHFVGRLPLNLIKEMFFTAAPLDAQKAKEWMVVNHLVASAELEAATMELAATMATKSPMAMAVIKEQLRVLTDYQPIAAQVYERLQGLRRQAYDSSDYLEGLRAFAEKRQPVFRGT